jgi:hypothetical protein
MMTALGLNEKHITGGLCDVLHLALAASSAKMLGPACLRHVTREEAERGGEDR